MSGKHYTNRRFFGIDVIRISVFRLIKAVWTWWAGVTTSLYFKRLRENKKKLTRKLSTEELLLVQYKQEEIECTKTIADLNLQRDQEIWTAKEPIFNLDIRINEIRRNEASQLADIERRYYVRSYNEQENSDVIGILTLGISKAFAAICTNRISPAKAKEMRDAISNAANRQVRPLQSELNHLTPIIEKQVARIQARYNREVARVQTTLNKTQKHLSRLALSVPDLKRKTFMITQSLNISEDLDSYAWTNGTRLAAVRQAVGEVFFDPLVAGDITLYTLEAMLGWLEQCKDHSHLSPELLSFKQFINHSLIPHRDFYLILALKKNPNLDPGQYPHLTRRGFLPVENASVFAVSPNSTVTQQIYATITPLNLEFLQDNTFGSLKERCAEAKRVTAALVGNFESAIELIRSEILAIVAEQKKLDAQCIEQKDLLVAAKEFNQQHQLVLSSLRRQLEAKEAAYQVKTGVREFYTYLLGVGQIVLGVLYSWAGTPLIISGLATIETGYGRSSAERSSARVELNYLRNEIAHQSNLLKDVQLLEGMIQKISEAIVRLEKDRNFKTEFGSAQKLAAVKEAFLTKSLLDFGERNLSFFEDLGEGLGFPSVDSWTKGFDLRLQKALTNFCIGCSDSNDVEVVIQESNYLTQKQATDPQSLVLMGFVEDYLKKNLGVYWTHAAWVDLINQQNLVGIGTKFYLDRQIINRVNNSEMTSVFGYQIATQSVLLEEAYDPREVDEIRSKFEFWGHRAGDRFLTSFRLQVVGEEEKIAPYAVDLLLDRKMKEFIQRAKNYPLRKTMPEMESLFLKHCTNEYVGDWRKSSDEENIFQNPDVVAVYPAIQAIILRVLSRLGFHTFDQYKNLVGEDLDELIVLTFLDFFMILGRLDGQNSQRGQAITKLLASKQNPQTFPLDFDRLIQLVEKSPSAELDLFLKVYSRNLEKRLSYATTEERCQLLNQITKVNQATLCQLEAPQIDFQVARMRSRNENYTLSNTIGAMNRV